MNKNSIKWEMQEIEERLNTLRIIMQNKFINEEAAEQFNRHLSVAMARVARVKQDAATKKLMTTVVIPDDELLARFAATSPRKGERMFEATLIPNGETSNVTNWDKRNFTAPNKAEAVKIAREYAERIAEMKLEYVYLAR